MNFNTTISTDVPAAATSMEDVAVFTKNNQSLCPRQKKDMLSDLVCFADCVHKPLQNIAADILTLRMLIDGINHVMAGISKKRLANIKVNVRRALRMFNGLPLNPAKEKRSFAWRSFLDACPEKWQAYTLAPFAGHCSACKIEPQDVSDKAVLGYTDHLNKECVLKNPGAINKRLAQTWNGLIEPLGTSYKKLTIAYVATYQTTPIENYPAAFSADEQAYFKLLAASDSLDHDAPALKLRPMSLRNIKASIRQCAQALQNSGVQIKNITSLSVLVDAENFKAIMRQFAKQNGGEFPSWLGITHAAQLVLIASRYVKLSEAEVKKLREMKAKVTQPDTGYSLRNSTRLAQFDDDRVLDRLLNLPQSLMARACANETDSHRAAMLAMFAVAIELLLSWPLRMRSLASLNIDEDFQWIGKGKKESIYVHIPPEKTKNREPLEADLGPTLTKMIARYLQFFRGRLASDPGPWLFPKWTGGHRDPGNLGEDLKYVIYKETGIEMHAHLFRHLALELIGRISPQNMEHGRLLLGHRRSETTRRVYALRKGKHATAHYQKNVLGMYRGKS